MLFERIAYADDFPMRITVGHMREDPLHYHLDIEFVYVLRGAVQLKNGCCLYTLREGDVFTNSGHEVHSITSASGDSVIAQIQISTHYYAQYFPNLGKACYRTYSKKADDKKHDRLRSLMLQILLLYAARSSHYRSECAYLMVDVLRHLDRYFNLFVFDKSVMVGFDRGDPVAVERISRICQYIYQYSANNVTLDDLSQMEHLSPFYLSHLIKGFTGMNFRDFLCFARVEWSEIKLLDSDRKISQIAREVGFSTTAYYEKYFRKWFMHGPAEHRQQYAPLVKSDLRPTLFEPLKPDEAAALVRSVHAGYQSRHNSGAAVTSLHLALEADIGAPAQGRFGRPLTVEVTPGDLTAFGGALYAALSELAPAEVVLRLPAGVPASGTAERVLSQLREAGYRAKAAASEERAPVASFALDSVARAVCLLDTRGHPAAEPLTVSLRDTGDARAMLQGQAALMTAGGLKKPAFYACQALSRLSGDILYQSNQACVVRMGDPGAPAVAVIVCSAGDEVRNLCLRPAGLKQVKDALSGFRDELDLSVNINLRPGRYTVIKYSMTRSNNLFACLSALQQQDGTPVVTPPPGSFFGAPAAEMYPEDVIASCHLHFALKGVGIQMAVVRPT